MLDKPRVVVIGNGGFAVDCLAIMRESSDVRMVISDPDTPSLPGLLDRFCAEEGIRHIPDSAINSAQLRREIAEQEPDFLFSVYNLRIIKPSLLAIPRKGTVNFHNGPLPRYRGVNVYSWAIINGETEHGVAWHLVDEGIDTGDVIAQRAFAIGDDDTPLTLARKGFRAGVELLADTLQPFLERTIQPEPQSHDNACYYSNRDHPNHGLVDFRWEYSRIERFVRGLNFQPMENPFVYATAVHRGRRFYPQHVTEGRACGDHRCGTITEIAENAIFVQVSDGTLGITEILDSDLRSVSPQALAGRLNIRIGDILESPST